jgi:hypothetical protein
MAKKIKTKVKKLGKSQIPKIVVSKLKRNCWTCEEYKREQLLKQLEIQKETIKALNQISQNFKPEVQGDSRAVRASLKQSTEQPQKSSLQPSESIIFKAAPRAEMPTNIIQLTRPVRKTLPIESEFQTNKPETKGITFGITEEPPVIIAPAPIIPKSTLIIETDNLKQLPSMEEQEQPKRLSIPRSREKQVIIETRKLKRTKPVQTPLFEPIQGQEEILGIEMKPKQEKRGRPRLPVEGPINKPSEELLTTIQRL